ncbi:MAG: ribbon-helix-helix protein, CopG family [Anaerolineaceae bacterium]|nr:ribbon-helix-helix protein, CopG family [Anaerolineaceae bacterium]
MAQEDKKQQFNVYLPPDLIKGVKHASIDTGQSLSLFVEDALRAHIARIREEQTSGDDDT